MLTGASCASSLLPRLGQRLAVSRALLRPPPALAAAVLINTRYLSKSTGYKQESGINNGPSGHGYKQSPGAGPLQSPLRLSEIHEMIAKRLRCKMSRNFQDADTILRKMRDNGVHVNDTKREWRADGQRYGSSKVESGACYTVSVSSTTIIPPENTSKHIQSMVEQRVHARSKRDFETADRIQFELANEYNVTIDDKLREWAVHHGTHAKKKAQTCSNIGTPLTKDEHDTVVRLVQTRIDAKRSRQFDEADRIRDYLLDEFQVRCDQRRGSLTWVVVSEEYTMRRSESRIDEDTKTYIANRIGDRVIAKVKKEYETADAIRQELYSQHNVHISDRTKEWWIDSSGDGAVETHAAHNDDRLG